MKFIVVSLALLSLFASLQAKKVITCYFGSWAVYRPGDGKYDVENIDPMLCTHAIFGFAGLGFDNKISVLDTWNEIDKGAYKRFNDMRNINPELKTLIAVGGWNEGSPKYSDMAADPAKRKTFVDSTVEFLETHGFNGLDLDWEYPNQRGGKPEDVANYITLLNELRDAYTPKGYLLTVACGAGKTSVDLSYDVPAMAKVLDFFHLMEYDLHGPWEDHTGHHSQLYSRPEETGDDLTLNVDYSVNYYLSKGAPKEKIVMGMPLYGKTFSLRDPAQNGIAAPVSGPGMAGPYTREAGTMGYNEICVNIQSPDWTVVVDNEGKNPYTYNGNQWVGYDDIDAITIKAQYINDMGLAGGMVWSIETDDFHGNCHGVPNPLLRTLNEALNGNVPTVDPNLTTTQGTTGTGQTTRATTPANTPPPDGLCTQEGYVRDPVDCAVFYYCQADGDSWRVFRYTCGPGEYYNPEINGCDFEANVDC